MAPQKIPPKTSLPKSNPSKLSTPSKLNVQPVRPSSIPNQNIIFFDTGPIISLVISRMSFILPELKKQYGGHFYITPAVKLELIDRPLTMNRYKFEALQCLKLLNDGVIELYEDVPVNTVNQLISLANTSFLSGTKNLEVLQQGEVESVACALKAGAQAVVVDERALRLFIEDSDGLRKLLTSRFEKEITPNQGNINAFSSKFKGMILLRSIELVCTAYKLHLYDGYAPPKRDGKAVLLDALLWAVKSNGCAVNEEEIEEMKAYLLRL